MSISPFFYMFNNHGLESILSEINIISLAFLLCLYIKSPHIYLFLNFVPYLFNLLAEMSSNIYLTDIL